jgi:RNase H-fold protein (predicted Holliday junction resolvase)
MAGKEAYIKDADIIYLQTGFDKTDDQIRESVRYAISLGKPVVVSEYHKEGTSEEARRIGDLICNEFPTVVGTGNGRGSTTCASYAMPEEEKSDWEEFHNKYDDELAVIMLAMITFSAATLITLPFQMQYNYANEDGAYEVLFAAPINESTDGGFTINESGRVMGFISGTFDKLFGEPNGDTRRNSDRR